MSSSRKLIPLTKWDQHHPWPSIAGLRGIVNNAKSNGFDKVMVRIGKRILIDEAAFFVWVDGKDKANG